MELYKNEKEIETKNSISYFLFSNSNNNKTSKKSSTLMFGGDYTNNKKNENDNSQKNEHKKVPMFGNNNTVNTNNNNNKTPKFEFSVADIKPYNVRNPENQKMLKNLEDLVDFYKNIFSEDDLKKICFLIDKLSNEL